jgi:hypothetical protein
MSESNWSLHLSNPSLQAGSTRSSENEILRSEWLRPVALDRLADGVASSMAGAGSAATRLIPPEHCDSMAER